MSFPPRIHLHVLGLHGGQVLRTFSVRGAEELTPLFFSRLQRLPADAAYDGNFKVP